MAKILHPTEAEFDGLLSVHADVLVDFWASWCGPCRSLSPIIDEIAEEKPDLLVMKVNVDEHPELAARFSVMSIPTLLFFRDGTLYDKRVGLRPKEEILSVLR